MKNSPVYNVSESEAQVTKIEGKKEISGIFKKVTNLNEAGETFTFSSLLYAPANPVEREFLADSMITENEPDDLILEIQSLIHSTL